MAPILGNSMDVPLKLRIALPYDLAILLLGIYLKNWKIFIHRDIQSWN